MLRNLLPAFLAVSVILAILASSVDARPLRGTIMRRALTEEERSWSNFKRLARGIPPRAPIFKKRLPGITPTPVKRSHASASASASPSPSPSASAAPSTFTGRIQIKKSLTSPGIGFVNNSAPGLSVDIKGLNGTDLRVKLTTVPMTKTPVSILATNPSFHGSVFIGGASNATLATGSDSIVRLSNVPQTRSHDSPTSQGASAIWTLDSRTHQLLPHWVNGDATHVNTTIAYSAAKNSLFLTGDLVAYNSGTNSTAEAVEFYLSN